VNPAALRGHPFVASLLVIGRALGHHDQRATQIYARLSEDPVRASMQAAANAMMRSSGEGETQDPDFELMSLYVNGNLVGSAHAPGGGQGCAAMGPVVSDPAPPQQVTLQPGTHTLFIDATTNDPLYHFGAWYRFDLTFQEAP